MPHNFSSISVLNPRSDIGAIALAHKHCLIERIRLRGRDYEEQAGVIREMCDKYHVTFIGIDVTGLGEAVAQHVEKFFPFVTCYQYSPDQKSQMVLQALHIIDHGRLKFDAGAIDLVPSLLSIRRQVTKGARDHVCIRSKR